MNPVFVAREKFGPWDGEKWEKYIAWAKIPNLTEIVGLDSLLCPRLLNKIEDEDWSHIVNEDFHFSYFGDLDYLLKRVANIPRRNILGLYRNPNAPVQTPPAAGDFVFLGYELIEDQTQISALTNCGGFPESFTNDELNQFGLLKSFARACEIQRHLAKFNPEEHHAQCKRYAIWRLNEVETAG